MTPRQYPERVEQRNITHLAQSLGGKVYTLGTTRRRTDHPGTMQTPGLPDLWIWLPPVPYRPGRELPIGAARPIALWWEVKAARGRATPEQRAFADLCLRSQTPYGLGGLHDFITWLERAGRLDPRSVSHTFTPDLEVTHG
jgi:hypothetical protein